jgi:hypothetical protein
MRTILGYDAASRGNRFHKFRRHIIIRNAIQISSDAVLHSSTKVLKQHSVQTFKEQIFVAQASIFQSILPATGMECNLEKYSVDRLKSKHVTSRQYRGDK